MLMNFPFLDAGMINTPAEIAEVKTQNLSATNAIITGTLSAFNFTVFNVTTIGLSALDVEDIKTKTLTVESSGTGPALQVKQLGNQPIASFVDLDNSELVRINNNGFTTISDSLSVQKVLFTGSRQLMTGDGAGFSWIGRQSSQYTEASSLAIGFNDVNGSINDVRFQTNGSSRLIINNTGQVLINGPATDNVNKLHVTGAIKSIGTAANRPGLSIINAENFDPGQPLTVDGRARVVHGMTFQAGITNFADQSDHSHVIWAAQNRQGWQFIQNGGNSSSSVNTFSVNTIGFNAATTPFNEANIHSINTTNVTVGGSFPFVASNVAINFNTNTPALSVNQIVAITYNPGLVGFVANTYNGRVISGPTPVTVSGASRFQYIFEVELRDPINFDSSIKGFTTIPLNQANNLNALRIFTLQNEIQGTKVSLQGSYRGIPRYVLVNINGHNAYEGQTIIFRSTGSAKLGLVPADYSGHVKEVINANQFVISLGSVMEGFRSTNTDSYFNTTDWTIIKGSNDPVHLYTPALTHLYFQRFQTSDTSSTTTGGNRAVALGSSAEVDSDFSYAMGHNSGVYGEHSTVLGGKNNYILGTYSSIIGGQNVTIPANVTNTQVIGMSSFTANVSNTVFLNRLNIQLDSSRDIVAGLTQNAPMFTYRNGTGAWFHAGKHPTSDLFLISHGLSATTNPVVAVTPGGRVGIGTTTPTTVLHVSGNSEFPIVRVTGSNSPYFELQNPAATAGGFNRFFRIGHDANGKTYFENVNDNYTNSRTRILIDSTNNGNIGIGTQTPNSKIHIYGDQNSWIDGILLEQGGLGGRAYAISSRNDGLLSFSNETAGENRYLMTFGPGEGNAVIGRIPGVVPIPPANQRLTVIGNLSTTGNLTINGSISATSIVAVQQPLIIQQALSGFQVDGFLTVNGNVSLSGNNRNINLTKGTISVNSTDPSFPNIAILGTTLNAGQVSSYAVGIGSAGGSRNDLTFGSDSSYAYIQSWNNKPLVVNAQGNNILLTNSNLGIGTTTPNERLTVVGYISASRVGGIGNIALTHPYESGLTLINSTTNQQWDILNSSPSSPLLTGTLTFFNRNLAANLQPGSNVLVLSGNNVGINTSTPTVKLAVLSQGSEYSNPANSNVAGVYVHNFTNNNANAHAYVSVRSSGVSGGDAFVSYDIAGVNGWSTGIDNSDEDKFKISNWWSDVGLNNRITITQTGLVGISATNPNATLTVGPPFIGTAQSTTFNTNAGSLGLVAGDVLKLANIGFSTPAPNGVSLGFKARRLANGNDWQSTAIGLLYDVDNTSPVNNSQIWMTAGGNVGVGTSTPSAKLHVSGAGFNGGGATFEGTDSGNGVNIRGYNGAGINDTTFVTLSDNTSSTFTVLGRAGTNATGEVGRFRIGHGGAERFSILSNGNVGIGTISPLDPLDVSVSTQITGYNDFVTFRQTNSAASVHSRLLFGQISTNNMFIEAGNQDNVKGNFYLQPYGGNVMIGSALPSTVDFELRKSVPGSFVISKISNVSNATGTQARLDLATGSPNAYSILYQQDGSGAFGAYSHGPGLTGGMFFTAASASPIVFRQDGSPVKEIIRISREGNVGISTSTPQNKLSVRDGDISLIAGENLLDAGRSIRFFANAQDDTTNNYAEIKGGAINAGTSPQQGYLRFNTSGIERMRISSDGTISATGSINAGTRLYMSADGSNFRWIGAVGTGTDGSRIGVGLGTGNPSTGVITDIRLRTNDVNRVAVLSSGNVGIGTDVPNERLTVVGNISAISTDASILNLERPNVLSVGCAVKNLSGTTFFGRPASTNGNDYFSVASSANLLSGPFFFINSLGNVGIGTATPDADAILQLDSTTKGFLPPRMTTTQRNAIAAPVPAGLMVYNSTTNLINYYTGTTWVALATATA